MFWPTAVACIRSRKVVVLRCKEYQVFQSSNSVETRSRPRSLVLKYRSAENAPVGRIDTSTGHE